MPPTESSADASLTPERAQEIRTHLGAILASVSFEGGVHKRRPFLEYVVDRTLEGDRQALEEETIGALLFGNQPGCPYSETVPIVARRARASLQRYYAREGRASPFHIEIPQHSYVAEFRKPSAAGLRYLLWAAAVCLLLAVTAGLIWAAVRAARPKPLFLAVAVTSCSNLGGLERLEGRAEAFGPAIAQDLREFRGLRVSTPGRLSDLNVPFPNYPLIASRLSVDALVRCSLYPMDGGGYGIIAQLIDGHSSLRLWWDNYPTDGAMDKQVASDIALAVARTARVAYPR